MSQARSASVVKGWVAGLVAAAAAAVAQAGTGELRSGELAEAGLAAPGELRPSMPFRHEPPPQGGAAGAQEETPLRSMADALLGRRVRPTRFGAADSRWWTVGAGVAYDFHENTDINFIRGSFSQFLADDVEFCLELNGWYFDQAGEDAFGLNPAMIFRWHFINTGRFTAYADLGIGVLMATHEVPNGGTPFDFMPRAGIGITTQITDSGVRLQVGVRWHHISNARIVGDTRNPSRDAPMIYGGLIFPF